MKPSPAPAPCSSRCSTPMAKTRTTTWTASTDPGPDDPDLHGHGLVPFTPILAPELLANEQPKPPVVTSTSAGLPKRTVSNSAARWKWSRGRPAAAPRPRSVPEQAFTRCPATRSRPDPATVQRRPSDPVGPGSALPKPDGSAPSDDYQVKALLGTRTYHPAGSGDFNAVKAEVWFRSTEEAEHAGFSRAE